MKAVSVDIRNDPKADERFRCALREDKVVMLRSAMTQVMDDLVRIARESGYEAEKCEYNAVSVTVPGVGSGSVCVNLAHSRQHRSRSSPAGWVARINRSPGRERTRTWLNKGLSLKVNLTKVVDYLAESIKVRAVEKENRARMEKELEGLAFDFKPERLTDGTYAFKVEFSNANLSQMQRVQVILDEIKRGRDDDEKATQGECRGRA